MNALQINEVDNEVLNDADQYLREHKILEPFEVSRSLMGPNAQFVLICEPDIGSTL